MNTTSGVSRPTSLAEWAKRAQQIWFPLVEESRQRGLNYHPQPADLFISPFAKCGTTWLQQIVHSLRTRGDLDFDDVSRVIPWLEMAHGIGLDLYAPQRGPFRAFKSHLSWDDIPKGGRYIVSFRDPKDSLLSLYHFLNGWWWEAGTVSLPEFARSEFGEDSYMVNRGPGSYWHHLISWWEQRNNPNVLLLCYEAMKEDLPAIVLDIAAFVGLEPDESLLDIVLRQSSLGFMLAHKAKFDDRLMHEWLVNIGCLPPGGDSAKVRTGRVGDHRTELTADISLEMDSIWHEVIEASFGLPSFQALHEALNSEK